MVRQRRMTGVREKGRREREGGQPGAGGWRIGQGLGKVFRAAEYAVMGTFWLSVGGTWEQWGGEPVTQLQQACNWVLGTRWTAGP